MKWLGGLMAAALVGCGVGVDDPEGQAAADPATQAVLVRGKNQGLSSEESKKDAPAPDVTTSGAGNLGEPPEGLEKQSSTQHNPVGLPQDPVPIVHVGDKVAPVPVTGHEPRTR